MTTIFSSQMLRCPICSDQVPVDWNNCQGCRNDVFRWGRAEWRSLEAFLESRMFSAIGTNPVENRNRNFEYFPEQGFRSIFRRANIVQERYDRDRLILTVTASTFADIEAWIPKFFKVNTHGDMGVLVPPMVFKFTNVYASRQQSLQVTYGTWCLICKLPVISYDVIDL